MAQKEKGLWSYKLTSKYEEVGSKEPVYCVTFNDVDPEHRMVFATCGNRRIGVYECQENGTIEPLQCYVDESEQEEFFAVTWGIDDRTGAPLLLAAGLEGVCKVLDCNTQKLLWAAVGHGNAINDISVQPSRPELFLTASRDSSVRLWNMRTEVCVMIMTGDGGHTNEVLSVDFHPFRAERFVSCGMDAHIKIWSFKSLDNGKGVWGTGQMSAHLTADHTKYIDRSFEHDKTSEKSFPTGHLGAPAFSTQKVHMNYTDCVRFMGDLILSKSVTNCIVLWRPLHQDPEDGSLPPMSSADSDEIQRLQEFNFQDGSIWFLRFSVDPRARVLACGNQNGLIYAWDLRAQGAKAGHPQATVQSLGKRAEFTKMAIRQTAVSHDGAIILGCGDSGIISRLDRQK